ncbi:MAG: DUF2202 domain-containing protein [Phycisphaerales bacterium]
MRTMQLIALGSLVSLTSMSLAGPGGGCSLCAGEPSVQAAAGLDQAMIDTLVAMREEEKLARDVYLTLGEKWDEPAFGIAESEKRHLEAMKGLLDRFGIEDPIKDDTRGVFTSERYAKLYAQLIERGSVSRVEALRVGALIEELDLTDLRQALAQAEDESIERVLGNLQRATRNHLRAFAAALKAQGAAYESQYLTQDEFDSIAGSPRERGGMGGGQGNRQGSGRSMGG